MAHCLSILKPPAGVFSGRLEPRSRQPAAAPSAEVGANPPTPGWLPAAAAAVARNRGHGGAAGKSEFTVQSTLSSVCFGETLIPKALRFVP